MRHPERKVRRVGAGAVAVLAFLASALASGAAYVITTQGARVDGTDIRAKSDGEIILTTAVGTRTFLRGQYLKAVADKPAEIDQAVKLVEAKRFDEAAKMLEDVILKYRYLDWDNQARAMLPKIYTAKGDPAGAAAAYDKLFAAAPKAREEADLLWAYRDALLNSKQFDKLERDLDAVIAGGDRAAAARAQIMRGDVRAAQNQLEAAALDYLRTVVLFAGEAASQPAALLKAGTTLEKLRDPRAKDMLNKLVNEYPDSPEAAQARAKPQGG